MNSTRAWITTGTNTGPPAGLLLRLQPMDQPLLGNSENLKKIIKCKEKQTQGKVEFNCRIWDNFSHSTSHSVQCWAFLETQMKGFCREQQQKNPTCKLGTSWYDSRPLLKHLRSGLQLHRGKEEVPNCKMKLTNQQLVHSQSHLQTTKKLVTAKPKDSAFIL